MEFWDYVRIAKARWVSILVITVVIGAVVSAYAWSRPKQYESTVSLFATSAAGDGTPALTGVLASQQSTVSFAAFVKSEALAANVIRSSGVSMTVSDLLKEVKATSEGSSLTITVKDTDPHRAQALAQAYGTGVQSLVHDLAGAQTASHLPINVTVYDPASFPDKPVSMKPTIAIIPGLVLGLLVGIGVAVLRDVAGNRKRSESNDDVSSGL